MTTHNLTSSQSAPARPQAPSASSKQQALVALEAALGKKALEPVLLEIGAQAYTDYLLVLSGTSDRHVQTIADAVIEAFAALRKRPIGVEGVREGQWALIDFGDLVVHVFYHPLREFYDLEGLWCDSPRVAIDVPPDARAGQLY